MARRRRVGRPRKNTKRTKPGTKRRGRPRKKY